MDENKEVESMTTLFENYRRRLSHIGLQKSFSWALVVGFMFEFVVAFIIWFFHMSILAAVLIMIGILLVATLGATPIIYTLFYKPTKTRIARMIDKLGLEERFVTMCEHEDDDSFIAELQRKDAREKLASVSEKQFFFRLSRLAAIVLTISIGLGLVMGIVSTLSAGGLIPGGDEIFAQNGKDPDKDKAEDENSLCIIVYSAGDGGIVSGETVQTLQKGQDTTPVTAMPDTGYDFAGWSDGDPRATRIDYSVQSSMTLTAMFVKKAEVELPEVADGDGDGPGGPGNNANGSTAGQNGASGGSGNRGEKEGEDTNGEASNSAGTVKDKEDNSVIDGSSDYKNVFDYEDEIQRLLDDESLSDDVKDFLNNYLDALRQMQEADKMSS